MSFRIWKKYEQCCYGGMLEHLTVGMERGGVHVEIYSRVMGFRTIIDFPI